MQLRVRKAFTLIELLVVIAIIALLMSIVVPTLHAAKEQARRAMCASNLRQHVFALAMYANENSSKLPLSWGLPWLWDLDSTTADLILESGATRAVFYCPSNRQQERHIEKYWNYHGGYRVTGYFWMMDSAKGRAWQPYGSGDKRWLRTVAGKAAVGAELVTDVTLSNEQDYGPPTYSNGNFAKNSGGMYSRYGIYDVTSHLWSEAEPTGGNMGYADCHVHWRPFKKMERRFPPGAYPTHWW